MRPRRCAPLVFDALQHALGALGKFAVKPVAQQLGIAQNGVERRSELMAHIGEEARFMLARKGELAALFLDPAEQPRIAHGEHRLMREGLHQAHLARRERTRPAALDKKGAEHALGRDQRDDKRRAKARRNGRRAQGKTFALADFGNLHCAAVLGHLAEQPVEARQLHLAQGGDERRVKAMRFGEMERAAFAVEVVDGAAVRLGEFDRAGQRRLQHLAKFERSGERPANLFEGDKFTHRTGEIMRAVVDLLLQ